MEFFHYQHDEFYVEEVSLQSIAERYGTPCYVYSRAAIEANWRSFNRAFANHAHRICYAVKANSNIAILNILAKLNSGFDIVSQGELERVLAAQGNPANIVFSGVGKQSNEIQRALDVGIYCFNIESETELDKINSIAKKNNIIAKIALRINPNIDAKTHPYIATGLQQNKFGIEAQKVLPLCQKIKTFTHLNLIGIGCHIGSQLTEIQPFLDALDCLLRFANEISAAGFDLKTLNIGGGLGIRYRDEQPPLIDEYVKAVQQKICDQPYEIILEPGRIIVGNAGVLLTRVEYIKRTELKNFAVIDAGMNDLIRPALYDAWQDIVPIIKRNSNDAKMYDIVGPICESGDFLGKERYLSLQTNDLLAVCSAGAYGFSMSSNYNSRPRAVEVLVDKNKAHVIRRREEIEDLFAHEQLVT